MVHRTSTQIAVWVGFLSMLAAQPPATQEGAAGDRGLRAPEQPAMPIASEPLDLDALERELLAGAPRPYEALLPDPPPSAKVTADLRARFATLEWTGIEGDAACAIFLRQLLWLDHASSDTADRDTLRLLVCDDRWAWRRRPRRSRARGHR